MEKRKEEKKQDERKIKKSLNKLTKGRRDENNKGVFCAVIFFSSSCPDCPNFDNVQLCGENITRPFVLTLTD